MKLVLFAFFYAVMVGAFAQTTATPSILYTNVTIHVGNGEVVSEGQIGWRDGKIDFVGPMSTRPTQRYTETIDGKGQQVYPGVIAPNTRLGLEEIAAVRATRDFREVGRFNPNIRSIIAYNTDSHVIPTLRSNGVLLAQVVPEGGYVSGQSSVVYTQGDNWEDAAMELDNCIHIRWPQRVRYTGWWAQRGRTERDLNYEKRREGIRVYLEAAEAYTKKKNIEQKNLKFEAMRGLFDGSKRLVVHVSDARSMMDVVQMLQPYGMKLILQGAEECWQIPDFLKENDVAVILTDVHRLPRREDTDIDQPYKTPALLYEKGVRFAFSQTKMGSWNARNLMFQAGQAVAYGLDKEAALSAITLNTAQILGIDDRVGSLKVGKDATLLIVQGDLLDMRQSIVSDAYLAGQKANLSDKQKELYNKYQEKYDLKKEK